MAIVLESVAVGDLPICWQCSDNGTGSGSGTGGAPIRGGRCPPASDFQGLGGGISLMLGELRQKRELAALKRSFSHTSRKADSVTASTSLCSYARKRPISANYVLSERIRLY